ncbi:acyl carrier protein [Kitasatospora sp. NBC_00315]|uniref:acyl carrier protein n=1 Tax=Kitasatospora sp. NBC_00315 TaxID=2975963 RepID=UPI00324A796D
MNTLTLDALVVILRESAGEDESIDLGGDIADQFFTDLGYDSLALLETAGRIQREYRVTLDDDQLGAAETPQQFLDAVNGQLAART